MATPSPPPVGAIGRPRTGEYEEAKALSARVLARDPGDGAALYVLALAHIGLGEFPAAHARLTQLLARKPDSAEAHLTLARLLSLQGEHRAALARYRRAAELRRGDPAVGLALVEGLLAAGEVDEAIARCRGAIRETPEAARLHKVLGSALLAAGDGVRAEAAFRRALALDPTLPSASLGLARTLLILRRARDALPVLDGLLDSNARGTPFAAEAWFLRGSAYKAVHADGPAITALERAIELAPEHARAHLALGNCYAEAEDWPGAKRALQRARELDPTLIEAEESLGSALLRSGDVAAAEASCRRALARDPDRIVARQNLAAICAASDRPAEAARHRDGAYQRQSVFVATAAASDPTVLMPVAAAGGNVPTKYLFPASRYTIVRWYVAYADARTSAHLPRYDIIFNAIADPDFASEASAPLRGFLRHRHGPLLNAPDAVAATRRDRLPRLLADIPGIVVPPIRRCASPLLKKADLGPFLGGAGLTFPLLLRPAGSHGGKRYASSSPRPISPRPSRHCTLPRTSAPSCRTARRTDTFASTASSSSIGDPIPTTSPSLLGGSPTT